MSTRVPPNTYISDFVRSIYPVRREIISYINKNTYTCHIRKGEPIIRSGEISRHLYLIRKGAVRAYIRDGGKDITTWICAEQDIITSIRGFHMQQPSIETIETIEDCDLAVASYEDLQYLYEHFTEMNIVGRKLLEKYYQDAEDRALIARLSSATSKYHYFVKTKGAFLNRIPLKYISSYLGMTTETLSRIRSKISRGA